MDIINHYKSQVNKSLQGLYQQNIISENDLRDSEKYTDCSHSSMHSRPISTSADTQQQSCLNPYTVVTKPLHLPKSSRCIACPKPGKYRCPQCLQPFCTSSHYKSHNLFCSQSFYKRQVETEMKSLKSTTQQKQQVREMLKEHYQAKEEESQLNLMTEERLIQLLEVIENCEKKGKEVDDEMVKLSEGERQRLSSFIKSMQERNAENQGALNNQNQNPQKDPLLLTLQQPYWLITDGLDYYFMQQLEIEQFSLSSHLSLIIHRETLAKKYRHEIRPLNQLTKVKPSPLIREDILQYLIIWVLVNLVWSGDFGNNQEIFLLFDKLYVNDLGKNILQKQIKAQQASAYAFARLKQNIAQLQAEDLRKLMSSWYRASAISSAKIIVKNKFLLIETLLRALQFFQNIQQNASSSDNKHIKKRLNRAIKHVKKLEFLLYYVKDQMETKIDLVSETVLKDDLFRHIYRCLTQEENHLASEFQEQKDFRKRKLNIEQIKEHGILIKELD